METKLIAGTVIKCPRKGHRIGVLTVDLVPGTPLNPTVIDYEPGQGNIAGEKPVCKLCGSQYAYFNPVRTIFTEHGWQPRNPQLEPVARK